MTALERTTKCFAAPLIDDVSEPLYWRLVRRRQRCILGVLLGHALALFIIRVSIIGEAEREATEARNRALVTLS